MKTKEEILQQAYMSANDLKVIIPSLSITTCVEYIKMVQEDMKEQNYFIPTGKTYLALTKLVRKKFGF